MPPLKIEQIKAPDLSVASEATARAGVAFERGMSSASDLLGKYQSGLEAQGDKELTNLLAGAKNEEEWNGILASTDFSKMNLSAGMRGNIIDRRDNILGYEKSRADTGLVGANIGNVNATAARTRNNTLLDTKVDNRFQETHDWNAGVLREDASIGGKLVAAQNDELANGFQTPQNVGPRADGSGINTSGGGGMQGRFMAAVEKSGVTNKFGLAAIAATGKHESGWSEKNGSGQWSDPSESGRSGTAGGYMSWNNDRLAAMKKFTGGDTSPEAQAAYLIQEDPQLMQKLNNAKSIDEAVGLMNNAWRFAGYDRPGGEAEARLNTAKSIYNSTLSPRQPLTQNPNQGGYARASANQALIDAQYLPSATRLAMAQGMYDKGAEGQAAIKAADTLNAEEFAANQRLELAANPDVLTPTEAVVESTSLPAGATAVETERNRAALLASVGPDGVTGAVMNAGTKADPGAASLLAGVLEERKATIASSPTLTNLTESMGFEASPAESLVAAMKGMDISTTPSEVSGAINSLSKKLKISKAEAAYSLARAAEEDTAFIPDWSVGGDNLSQNRAEAFAKKNFTGDGAKEGRQILRDFKTLNEEVTLLEQSVQTALARVQKSRIKNKGEADEKYLKDYKTVTEKLDEAVRQVRDEGEIEILGDKKEEPNKNPKGFGFNPIDWIR